MRKTGNLIIRETSKKSSRENPKTNTSTSFRTNQSKLSNATNSRPTKQIPYENMEIHKEMVRAENLTEN